MELKEAVQSLIEARDRYKNLSEQAKEAKAEYDRLSIEVVPELLSDSGLESVSTGDTVVYTREDLYANVDAAERGVFAAELRKMGEGDIITEYVFPTTLTAWAKDRLEEGLSIPSQVNLRRVVRAVPRKK